MGVTDARAGVNDQPTAFFRGPERLGRALRAPLVYVSMRRSRRGFYEIELEPLTAAGEKLPSGAATERYARVLERDIEADPAGWWCAFLPNVEMR